MFVYSHSVQQQLRNGQLGNSTLRKSVFDAAAVLLLSSYGEIGGLQTPPYSLQMVAAVRIRKLPRVRIVVNTKLELRKDM